ncbi:MAG: alpha/beta hydrolase [Lachnospiraceae bacterium]|nr:alpha/beta hydrolase [Lachnospiraceae bacterium]
MNLCDDAKNLENISYAKIGNGPKIMVILPGLALKSTIRSAEAIAANFSAFGEYTIYLFDDRDNLPKGYSLWKRADDVADLMQSLQLKDAYVYGASMGGMVGQSLAINHPELVKKLFLASTSFMSDKDTKKIIGSWMDLASQETLSKLIRTMNNDIYSKTTLEKFGEMLEQSIGTVSDEDLQKFVILAKAIMAFDSSEELEKIKCPICVVGAEADKVFSIKQIRSLAEKTSAEALFYGLEYGHGVYDEAADLRENMLEFFEE